MRACIAGKAISHRGQQRSAHTPSDGNSTVIASSRWSCTDRLHGISLPASPSSAGDQRKTGQFRAVDGQFDCSAVPYLIPDRCAAQFDFFSAEML